MRAGVARPACTAGCRSTALVATGFSYLPSSGPRRAEWSRELLPRVRDIRRAGSAAIDLCSVACGRLDAYYERGLNPWDIAAGGLIAREAGARSAACTASPPARR